MPPASPPCSACPARTLQLPDMPVASRLSWLQAVDPQACKLVALAGDRVAGMAALYPVPSLRRNHVRS